MLASAGCENSSLPASDTPQVFEGESDTRVATAVCNGDVETVEELITEAKEIDAVGEFGVTPLIWALTCHGLEFNDMKADEFIRTGRAPAIGKPDPRYMASIEALLKAGANPNAMIDGDFGPAYPGAYRSWIDGYSPVLIAAEFHEPDVLALLLEYGGDPNAMHGEGETSALLLAFSRGRWLDLGPQMVPFDERHWRNMFLLLDAGARLELAPEDQLNVVEMASLNRVGMAAQLLKTYPYTGDFEIIVSNLYSALEMDYPGQQERRELLTYLRDKRGIDTDEIWARYLTTPGIKSE